MSFKWVVPYICCMNMNIVSNMIWIQRYGNFFLQNNNSINISNNTIDTKRYGIIYEVSRK